MISRFLLHPRRILFYPVSKSIVRKTKYFSQRAPKNIKDDNIPEDKKDILKEVYKRWRIDKNNYFQNFRKRFLIDNRILFEFMQSDSFAKFMHKYYGILPFQITPEILQDFKEKLQDNENSLENQNLYFNLINSHKIQEVRKNNDYEIQQNLEKLSNNQKLFLYPFIRLFFQYLEINYEKELGVTQNLISISDLRLPHEWYPETRNFKRKIIYHYGPTNSGKTMTSVQHLVNSKRGIYCAPLRLLACEIRMFYKNFWNNFRE